MTDTTLLSGMPASHALKVVRAEIPVNIRRKALRPFGQTAKAVRCRAEILPCVNPDEQAVPEGQRYAIAVRLGADHLVQQNVPCHCAHDIPDNGFAA